MKTHLMIDFETLGTNPDTAVLSLGAVLFTRDCELQSKLWIFDLQEQFNWRRSINPHTLLWWMDQGAAAKSVFNKSVKEGISMKVFAAEFMQMIVPDLLIWGNGASFDVPILEHILWQQKISPPWKFWNIRCYRTVKTILPLEKAKQTTTKHDALEDATWQAHNVMEFLKENPGMDK